MTKSIKLIDLFAGPGGLGEGFTSVSTNKNSFHIGVSIEKDFFAHKTLSLRAFYRHFVNSKTTVPSEYYSYLAGDISREDLEIAYPDEWSIAYGEATCAELGNPSADHQPLIDNKISSALSDTENWVLIGGPPCQAYSQMGRSCKVGALKAKNLDSDNATVRKIFEQDERHTLYEQYLRIIAKYGPAVFVMENVKGILSSKLDGERIFPKILNDLRDPASAAKLNDVKGNKYKIVSFVSGKEPCEGNESEFLIKAENYGIPQARHRVILLGIREDVYADIGGQVMPLEIVSKVPVRNVLRKLPKLRSGFSKSTDTSEHWNKYFDSLKDSKWLDQIEDDIRVEILNSISELSQKKRSRTYIGISNHIIDTFDGWYSDANLKGLTHHECRSHMDSDLSRYLFVSAFGKVRNCSPLLKDFPKSLLPDHKNILQSKSTQKFADRFKVQLYNKPASTITSHISKDGHYFIHPDPSQCRSLTVREAARIQTFPDNYFFEGGRTKKYHQIGNAVPPYLAKQLAEVVLDIFERAK